MEFYLSARRKELGKTQKEVADYIGVSEATVSRWESGNIANMRRDRIKKYAEVLQTTPAAIMGIEGEYDAEFYENLRKDEAKLKRSAESLGFGVGLFDDNLVYRETVDRKSAHDQAALLHSLYHLNDYGTDDARRKIHSLRVLSEIVAVLPAEEQDKLISYAEFLDADHRQRDGLPPVKHQYQSEG